MFWYLRNRPYAIGVDAGNDSLKLVQLVRNGKGANLIAGNSEDRPDDVKPGSANWQRWAIVAMREAMATGRFHGREVVAAVPASDVFIDNIKIGAPFENGLQNRNPMLKAKSDKLPRAISSRIEQRLPFQIDDAVIKYIPTEQDNALVIATERKIIDRHLAMYERAGLTVRSIAVWPTALTNCYAKFFGRRKTDLEAIVMLLDTEANSTNVVICRHKNVLFACSIPIGAKQLNDEKIATRLVLELTGCRRRFASIYQDAQIERLIFLSGPAVKPDIYINIAKQMEMQAQMGDCMAAVEIANPYRAGINKRISRLNWATAFGLSLS
jgi:Tfp pilus assembly PilM family ATPase